MSASAVGAGSPAWYRPQHASYSALDPHGHMLVDVARVTGDDARAPLEGQKRPRPLEQHQHPVAEPDEIQNVDEEPGKPAQEARELQVLRLRDAGRAADGRHDAL